MSKYLVVVEIEANGVKDAEKIMVNAIRENNESKTQSHIFGQVLYSKAVKDGDGIYFKLNEILK